MSQNNKITTEETREQRFKRIAAKRTNDIIRRIRILGNCSNRSAYDYGEEQINKIFFAIDKEVKQARIRFTYTKSKKEFKL
ncbi:MAG: hypothetical protein WCW64_10975 [Phycisphaerae bacterium]|jgi:hypothetical protein